MNKRVLRTILSIIIAIFMVSVFASNVMAVVTVSSLNGKAEGVDGNIGSIGNQIVTVIRNIGIVVSVAVIMVLGIKYMMGSAEEKAEYKKTMLPYFIGAIILFSGSGIVAVIQNIGEGIKADPTPTSSVQIIDEQYKQG